MYADATRRDPRLRRAPDDPKEEAADRDLLARVDTARAAAIRRRAGDAVRLMAPHFPGDPATGRLDGDEEAADPFFERFESLACPVLDRTTGLCELYAWRPLSCRTFGPPVRVGGVRS